MIKKLQQAKISAMKEKNSIAKSILSMLHSDALVMAKKETRELTNDDIMKSAKTLIKRNTQAITDVEKGNGDASALKTEIDILYTFLPTQKTEDEIKAIIDDIMAPIPEEDRIHKLRGTVMKQLKTEHGDSIDMGFAVKYLGGLLS